MYGLTHKIQRAVCDKYACRAKDLIAHRRVRSVARPRQIGYWLMREASSLSFPSIGRRWNRHHTTIIYGCRFVDKRRLKDAAFREETDELLGLVLYQPPPVKVVYSMSGSFHGQHCR